MLSIFELSNKGYLKNFWHWHIWQSACRYLVFHTALYLVQLWSDQGEVQMLLWLLNWQLASTKITLKRISLALQQPKRHLLLKFEAFIMLCYEIPCLFNDRFFYYCCVLSVVFCTIYRMYGFCLGNIFLTIFFIQSWFCYTSTMQNWLLPYQQSTLHLFIQLSWN